MVAAFFISTVCLYLLFAVFYIPLGPDQDVAVCGTVSSAAVSVQISEPPQPTGVRTVLTLCSAPFDAKELGKSLVFTVINRR